MISLLPRDALPDVGPLVIQEIELPGCAETLRIARPQDFDRLLDAAEGDPEQNLPYWAEVWPSGVALAAAVCSRRLELRGRRVLEVGCGLGVTAIAAMRAGAALMATDYSEEALALCRFNCRREVGAEPVTKQINWRSEDPFGAKSWQLPFPLVLAADVLYERRDVDPLLAIVQRAVASGGELWLAEPGRAPAARFLEMISATGWTGQSVECAGPWPDREDNEKGIVVTVHFLRRPRK